MHTTTTISRLPDPGAVLADMGAPLDLERYDWAHGDAHLLTHEEVFQLTYAAQVEWGTEGTFASLDISRDPVVKEFLRIWLEQEVAHAQLLARVLAQVGAPVEPAHRTIRQRAAAQRGKRVNQLARLLAGNDFFGVHMTWGAVNELTTLRFYQVVRDTTRSELLRTVLRDVIAQEAVHYAFYRNVALRRLTDNPRGQRLVRWAMQHLWSPVGAGLRIRGDADRLMLGLFGERPSQVHQMDAQLNRIPGLAELDLVGNTVEHAKAAA